ncbi:hypothetical protein SAMN05444001_1241 [Parabacteroides chinchillae]|uniref:Uncharacterized protein n=1 Tax=Parabacteroides chinchillae TaxID=871327 RepID=A0A8G2FC71_9BACT|nr:hypothetical protein SAMN05444001_1241 [Parabacteroides chinchillae]
MLIALQIVYMVKNILYLYHISAILALFFVFICFGRGYVLYWGNIENKYRYDRKNGLCYDSEWFCTLF